MLNVWPHCLHTLTFTFFPLFSPVEITTAMFIGVHNKIKHSLCKGRTSLITRNYTTQYKQREFRHGIVWYHWKLAVRRRCSEEEYLFYERCKKIKSSLNSSALYKMKIEALILLLDILNLPYCMFFFFLLFFWLALPLHLRCLFMCNSKQE